MASIINDKKISRPFQRSLYLAELFLELILAFVAWYFPKFRFEIKLALKLIPKSLELNFSAEVI